MLWAKTTPRLMGIEVAGDYNDLKLLHQAIQSIMPLKKSQFNIDENKYDTDMAEHLEILKQYIRQAFLGNGEIKTMENGTCSIRETILQNSSSPPGVDVEKICMQYGHGNLYYSVKIPIIEAISHIFLIDEYLSLPPKQKNVQNPDARPSAAWHPDRSYLKFFSALMKNAVSQEVDELRYQLLDESPKERTIFDEYDFRYIDLLSTYYLTQCASMKNDDKVKSLLCLVQLVRKTCKADLLETEGIDMLPAVPDYTCFAPYLKEQSAKSEDGEVYMEEIFGQIDWKNLVW